MFEAAIFGRAFVVDGGDPVEQGMGGNAVDHGKELRMIGEPFHAGFQKKDIGITLFVQLDDFAETPFRFVAVIDKSAFFHNSVLRFQEPHA